ARSGTMYSAFPPRWTDARIARYATRDLPLAVGIARTRFSPSRAGPIASACGGYSSSIPCFFRISTILGSRPRSATRISHLMRRGPHKGSRGRRERVHIPGDHGVASGSLRTECPVGSVLPVLPHEPQL